MGRIIPLSPATPRLPKPACLKVRAPRSPSYLRLKGIMRELNLHTVCEEAQCPNIGECWNHGTATFMILGDVCTRACSYCAVAHGRPATGDGEGPARGAAASGARGRASRLLGCLYARLLRGRDHPGRSRGCGGWRRVDLRGHDPRNTAAPAP